MSESSTASSKCKQCGEDIKQKFRDWQRFCSVPCRNLWHKNNTVTITKVELQRLREKAGEL